MKTQLVRYTVKTRHGTTAEYSAKRMAIRAAKAEQRDGWPSWVRDMVSGEIIWGK